MIRSQRHHKPAKAKFHEKMLHPEPGRFRNVFVVLRAASQFCLAAPLHVWEWKKNKQFCHFSPQGNVTILSYNLSAHVCATPRRNNYVWVDKIQHNLWQKFSDLNTRMRHDSKVNKTELESRKSKNSMYFESKPAAHWNCRRIIWWKNAAS